jgi:hypothetical protein
MRELSVAEQRDQAVTSVITDGVVDLSGGREDEGVAASK